MAGIINSVKHVYGDLTSGRCKEKFDKMSSGNQIKTVLKVAGIALAVGIITGFLGVFGGGFLGFLLGISVMGLVGTAAFAYFTSDHNLGEQLSVCAKKCVECVKKCAKNVQEAL